ncbi:MAG: tripartite tricarboxylate transporter substrate-binding protein [Vicinamibacterales bacterium]
MKLQLECPVLTEAALTLLLIAPAAPGGGWDQTARVMQRVLAEIEPGVSVQVDNVPGAAGTIGLARFVQSERGNPDALLVMGLVMVSGVITNHSPVTPADATPIARLTGEFEVIAVPADSPYRSLRDLMAAFTTDPGRIAWGGGSAGGTDDLLIRLMAEQAGLAASRVNYIAFSGGGAALAAVLGGQVTAGVSGYAEFAGQIEAGQLRVLAVSSPARVPGINAPTLREEGVALDLANWRAVLAPPGLSDAEREALVARVSRLAASPAWKSALAQNGWEDLFLPGSDFRQFLLAEQARVGAVLERLAATDTARPAALTLSVTPMTLPAMVASLFAVVAVWFVLTTRRRWSSAGLHAPRSTLALGAALLIQPLLFPTAGFVIASTLLFVVAASALRGGRLQAARVIGDVALGGLVAAILYLAFSRGLGVQLPPFPL